MANYATPELLLVGAAETIVLGTSSQPSKDPTPCDIPNEDDNHTSYFEEAAW